MPDVFAGFLISDTEANQYVLQDAESRAPVSAKSRPRAYYVLTSGDA
jgi:hypothetical protein